MSKKITTEEFISQSIGIHGNKYDYSYVIYNGRKIKVNIKCNICFDIFSQFPADHIFKKTGCPNCAGVKKSNIKDFISKSIKKHPENKYDYSYSIYINATTKLKIKCNDCGLTFPQRPRDHLSGYGCPKCPIENMKWLQNEIIENFIKIHGDNYEYSEVVYIDLRTKVKIWCNKCSMFFNQLPSLHLDGCGHFKCCTNNISKQEILWLNYLKIDEDYRNSFLKIENKLFKFDAYDPDINTIYEFYGDYWHGNPNKYNPNDFNKNNKKTFGELYQKTMDRQDKLIKMGYKIIFIWESDWNKQCQKKYV